MQSAHEIHTRLAGDYDPAIVGRPAEHLTDDRGCELIARLCP
jgi:hypothetical protein